MLTIYKWRINISKSTKITKSILFVSVKNLGHDICQVWNLEQTQTRRLDRTIINIRNSQHTQKLDKLAPYRTDGRLITTDVSAMLEVT